MALRSVSNIFRYVQYLAKNSSDNRKTRFGVMALTEDSTVYLKQTR